MPSSRRSISARAPRNPATQQTVVELLHGTERADVVTVTKPGGTFVIRTPTAYIAALGTVVGVTAVDTASTNLADTISQQNIENLPMKGRRRASAHSQRNVSVRYMATYFRVDVFHSEDA